MIDPNALFVESPWYGVLEIVGEPNTKCSWGTEVWDGRRLGALVVTSTLRPLTPAAARMLGVTPGARVWDDEQKRKWEKQPVASCLR